MSREIKININSGRWTQDYKGDEYKPFPDVRPLSSRIGKRIKPGQEPDARQKLLFDNSQRNCNGYMPENSL